ncbi:MAG: hydroxymethylglutaryl-CoA synthase [Acidobacteriota bacterium]|nr:hydroxymethylglutaryl-CoA synthase [Acidobacteriota bacterium]
MSETTTPTVGIESIGLHLPPLALPVEELAKLRGEDPNKYTVGLGCSQMAICPPDYGVVDLAAEAARRALSRWDGDPRRIGLLAAGTETAVDMSRPLSAYVADELGLSGGIRSYEVKHACYGGTLALRQAAEWRLLGAAKERAALVVAADVALYEEGDPGEATQGAGAVAFVVDRPEIASIDTDTIPYSEPEFDFFRPVGDKFPTVNGKLSLECYKKAAEFCFQALINERDPDKTLQGFEAICFHVPFPKMVRKAVMHLAGALKMPAEKVIELFEDKVEPTMIWNKLTGNAYTASLWISVANALQGRESGDRIAAFSYGSGVGAELMSLVAGPAAKEGAWAVDIEKDLASRRLISGEDYCAIRAAAQPA